MTESSSGESISGLKIYDEFDNGSTRVGRRKVIIRRGGDDEPVVRVYCYSGAKSTNIRLDVALAKRTIRALEAFIMDAEEGR